MGSTINFGAALGSNQGVQWQVPRAFIHSFRLHHFPQRDASYLVAPLTSFFSKAPVNSGFATSWGIEPHGFVHRPVSSCNQHIAIFGEDAYDSNWGRPPFLPDAISLAYFIQWAYKLWFIWGGTNMITHWLPKAPWKDSGVDGWPGAISSGKGDLDPHGVPTA